MLAARAVSISVASRTLVENLGFALDAGECWAMLGRNGSGKTSLLLALAGLRRPRAGEVLLDGRPIREWGGRELARRRGILLQDEPFEYWGDTLHYALLGRFPHGGTGEDPRARAQALELLDELDLTDHAAQPYRTLSGGERQRARIAQLLLQDPQFFLLDEPLQHLDLKHQLTVMQALQRRANAGRAVLMALHEPIMAARFCQAAILLYDSGRIRLGECARMLTLDNLEALYQCRLEYASETGGQTLFPR